MVLILSNQIHAFTVPRDAKIWVAVFSEEYVPLFASAVKGQQGAGSVFQPGNALRNMVLEHLVHRDGSRMMKKACFYGICDAYLQSVTLEPRPDKTSFLVGNLLDWISENYTRDISLKKAAEVFGYEYHYLSRLLNKSYGIRFVDLVNGYRVEHAAQLLRTTQLPVSEIAMQSGFQSLRSFNQVFLAQTGTAPNTLRSAGD
jgi:AraC-like DNA-binding protein